MVLPETSALKIMSMDPATMYNPHNLPPGPKLINCKCVPPSWLTKLVEKHVAEHTPVSPARQAKLEQAVMREHYRCGVPLDVSSEAQMKLVQRLARGMGKGRTMMIHNLGGVMISRLLPR